MYNQQEEINKEKLIKDEQFLDDATAFLIDRGGYDAEDLMSAENVYKNYMEHFRFQNVNEVTAVNDLLYAQNADEESKERFARLMDTYDKMDSDLGFAAAGDYVAGVLSAPSTYAGIFTGGGAKVGALAAQQGVKLGIREILKRGAAGQALRSAATKGAVRAGAVEGTIGAGQVAAQEQVRVETGMQDEIRGGAVALGAATGAIPGGIFGAAAQTQRAVTENVAERVLKITEKQSARAAEHANRTTTKQVFEDDATGKTALDVYENLVSRKKAIEETFPEVETGRKIKETLKPDDAELVDAPTTPKPKMPLVASLEEKSLQNLAAFATKLMDRIEPLEGERFASILGRALKSEFYNPDSLRALAKDFGLKVSDLGPLLAAEFSQAGKTLKIASQLSQAEKKARLDELDTIDAFLAEAVEITNPAREAVEAIDDEIGKGLLGKANDALRRINKARIGLMTVQLATTTRNVTNGYMRNYVYAFDNLGAGLYNKTFTKAAAKQRLKKKDIFNPTDEQIKAEAERAVRLGNAQLRTAYDSFMFKDLMGITTAETRALTRLMQDERFGKSEAGKLLFMEMGDVADHAKMGGGILTLARKLNTLNTMSDNMFKRAILSRELNKAILAGGYEEGLNGVLKKGRFGDVDEDLIAKGMEEAIDFTYQTGRFQGKEGAFNSVADTFIQASSTQLGSTFVPFPRYLVNQFRFFYEHTPILGMVDAFGILNKSDFDQRIGKQLGGAMMLTGLYALRANHGDETTGPFEYKNPFGTGIVDAQASLGPFSAHAFAADAIYRYFNADKISRPAKIRDFVKALGGGQFRPTGLAIVDGLFDTYQSGINDGELDTRLEEMGARWLGNYMNTYTVGAGVLKDVVATLDPDMRVVADNTDVEFWPYVFKQATRSFPREITEGESTFFGRKRLESPTRTTDVRMVNPFMRQITGLAQQEPRNLAEREFDRLGLEYFEISPRKVKGGIQSSELTKEARANMGAYVEGAIQDYIINNPEYYGLQSDIEKKAALKGKLDELRSEARARVLDTDQYVTMEDQRTVAQARYFDISSAKRDLIAEYYNRDTGFNLGDTKDYLTALAVAEKYKISGIR
tara:strand:+ start:4034 stop:7306 length:3273 start_codon:yes stop_codon:yes gene_type:complete